MGSLGTIHYQCKVCGKKILYAKKHLKKVHNIEIPTRLIAWFYADAHFQREKYIKEIWIELY